MRVRPWPRSGRLLRHLCCASSLRRGANAEGAGVKAAAGTEQQRGPALTQERPAHYIALPWKEEAQRRSNRQRCAALPGSWRAHVPPGVGRHPGVSRADWPAGPQHTARPVKDQLTYRLERSEPQSPLARGGRGVTGSRGTGRAQRRRCLPCAPPGGRIGKARRSICSSALPRRRGAGTLPGSPAVRGGCPAVAPYQRLHRPVRGRLRRQAYLCDSSCASHGPPATARRQQLAVPTRAAPAVISELSIRAGEKRAHRQVNGCCQGDFGGVLDEGVGGQARRGMSWKAPGASVRPQAER